MNTKIEDTLTITEAANILKKTNEEINEMVNQGLLKKIDQKFVLLKSEVDFLKDLYEKANIETPINEILCVECGNRGFRRVKIERNTIKNVPVLECLNCKAILFNHESYSYIEEITLLRQLKASMDNLIEKVDRLDERFKRFVDYLDSTKSKE